VALQVEGVVNRSVNAEEALGRSRRLEPLQFALPSSDYLMRKHSVRSACRRTPIGAMIDGWRSKQNKYPLAALPTPNSRFRDNARRHKSG
jgi:hypothetical protein